MSTATRIRVRDIEHLKALCENGASDCFVSLKGGLVSRKEISWDGEAFGVFHGISGTYNRFYPEDLPGTFIGEAMKAGALFVDL